MDSRTSGGSSASNVRASSHPQRLPVTPRQAQPMPTYPHAPNQGEQAHTPALGQATAHIPDSASPKSGSETYHGKVVLHVTPSQVDKLRVDMQAEAAATWLGEGSLDAPPFASEYFQSDTVPRRYYPSVMVRSVEYMQFDNVLLRNVEPEAEEGLARIVALFEVKDRKFALLEWYYRRHDLLSHLSQLKAVQDNFARGVMFTIYADSGTETALLKTAARGRPPKKHRINIAESIDLLMEAPDFEVWTSPRPHISIASVSSISQACIVEHWPGAAGRPLPTLPSITQQTPPYNFIMRRTYDATSCHLSVARPRSTTPIPAKAGKTKDRRPSSDVDESKLEFFDIPKAAKRSVEPEHCATTQIDQPTVAAPNPNDLVHPPLPGNRPRNHAIDITLSNVNESRETGAPIMVKKRPEAAGSLVCAKAPAGPVYAPAAHILEPSPSSHRYPSRLPRNTVSHSVTAFPAPGYLSSHLPSEQLRTTSPDSDESSVTELAVTSPDLSTTTLPSSASLPPSQSERPSYDLMPPAKRRKIAETPAATPPPFSPFPLAPPAPYPMMPPTSFMYPNFTSSLGYYPQQNMHEHPGSSSGADQRVWPTTDLVTRDAEVSHLRARLHSMSATCQSMHDTITHLRAHADRLQRQLDSAAHPNVHPSVPLEPRHHPSELAFTSTVDGLSLNHALCDDRLGAPALDEYSGTLNQITPVAISGSQSAPPFAKTEVYGGSNQIQGHYMTSHAEEFFTDDYFA